MRREAAAICCAPSHGLPHNHHQALLIVAILLQAAAVDAANAERDAYKLSAQELQERSKVRRWAVRR